MNTAYEKVLLVQMKRVATTVYLVPILNPSPAMVMASDGRDGAHVSVSLSNRTPNWREMWYINNLFWDEEEVVIQYHPAKSAYVNRHANCLHLWRPVGQERPTSPKALVG